MNVLKFNQSATIETLLERNTSQREIARITGIDRKTVRSYQRRWQAEPSNSPRGPPARPSKFPHPALAGAKRLRRKHALIDALHVFEFGDVAPAVLSLCIGGVPVQAHREKLHLG